ncbi:hypothetical protein LTR51_006032 [Lithohypha guttulata]|nr:hypothetical protein LTR51_006032 [Lithohypha guttulata]
MTHPIPSREALRALARLCRSSRPIAQHHNQRSQSLRQPCLTASIQSHWKHNCTSSQQTRSKTTLAEAQEPHTFANDPSRYNAQNRIGPEPTRQGTSDPQMEATDPTLPDITNYYTLFPKTLPSGPPQPQSSLPDSSTITNPNKPPPVFHINPRELRHEFLKLQSLHHPDKFQAGTVAHQRAYALSTLLNNAYKTLSDPLLRSQYLLQLLYDIDVTTEDNSTHPSDPETLMVVMEAQEELENVNKEGGEEVVQRLKEENGTRIWRTEKELGSAFEEGDKERARDESVKLKYWMSLQSGLNEWEPGKEVRLTH